jgi:rhamnulokinase
MAQQHFLAFDFGAESGRAILGTLLNRERIELKEIHRFSTGQLRIGKHYYWNIYRFYEEVITSLHKCVNDENVIPQSIGVDTWGVDFGLIGKDGSLLRIPYSYRDPMTETSLSAFLEKMTRFEIYEKTGIALHKFNSIYQLYAMKLSGDPVLQMADKLLFIPDLMNYLLSGEAKSEFTFATTSQLYNPDEKQWDEELFENIGVSKDIMQEVVMPGTVIGQINETISRAIDVEGIKVIAVTSHDTASAIASVPAEGDNWAYISSGTWSLMGVENKSAIIEKRSLMFNFTNEGGVDETFRFLKNIMGLWILQQCRASWLKKDPDLGYARIVGMAAEAEPFEGLIDPDYPGFYNPLDMPAAIETYCRQTGQPTPKGIGSIARTILEGLALKYRMVMDQLELVTGRKINVIHIIGGGSKNELLCQFTANATGKKIVAGPAEATGLGNLLVQAKGLGYIEDLQHLRNIVRHSFDLKEYIPQDRENWEIAYEKFLNIAKQS